MVILTKENERGLLLFVYCFVFGVLFLFFVLGFFYPRVLYLNDSCVLKFLLRNKQVQKHFCVWLLF